MRLPLPSLFSSSSKFARVVLGSGVNYRAHGTLQNTIVPPYLQSRARQDDSSPMFPCQHSHVGKGARQGQDRTVLFPKEIIQKIRSNALNPQAHGTVGSAVNIRPFVEENEIDLPTISKHRTSERHGKILRRDG
jgi:hypothetical protein